MIRPEDYREEDIRQRPARRNKRPRSKDRPNHDRAAIGFVVAVDRGRYTVAVRQEAVRQEAAGPDEAVTIWSDPTTRDAIVTAVRARELGRKAVVVGDVVRIVGDLTGLPGTLARIVRVEPRRTALTRTADDSDPTERPVVANTDIMGIVTATASPAPRTGFIDRCLMAAFDAGLRPLLLATKTDLAAIDTLESHYQPLGVDVIPAGTDDDVTGLQQIVTGHLTVLVGQSGVGKSTLVNRLIPDSRRRTGHVNEVTGRGRHTSSSVVAIPLPDSGWMVDTPGIRSFGLAHVNLDRVLGAFPDLAAGTERCPRGCQHLPPDCELDDWVAEGHAGPGGSATLASIRRVISARDEMDYR